MCMPDPVSLISLDGSRARLATGPPYHLYDPPPPPSPPIPPPCPLSHSHRRHQPCHELCPPPPPPCLFVPLRSTAPTPPPTCWTPPPPSTSPCSACSPLAPRRSCRCRSQRVGRIKCVGWVGVCGWGWGWGVGWGWVGGRVWGGGGRGRQPYTSHRRPTPDSEQSEQAAKVGGKRRVEKGAGGDAQGEALPRCDSHPCPAFPGPLCLRLPPSSHAALILHQQVCTTRSPSKRSTS